MVEFFSVFDFGIDVLKLLIRQVKDKLEDMDPSPGMSAANEGHHFKLQ